MPSETDRPPRAPLEKLDGYLPIERHALIGDGAASALVGADGAISWLCLPRMDSPPIFASLLDRRRGGSFVVAPDEVRSASQRYLEDAGVVVTELEGPDGVVEITDALLLRRGADLAEDAPAGRGELLRSVRVRAGRVRLRVEVSPRGGAAVRSIAGGLALQWLGDRSLGLVLSADRPLEGLRSTIDLEHGDGVDLALSWGARVTGTLDRVRPAEALDDTVAAWRRWARCIDYQGPEQAMVRRSAVTLKLLDHVENGAIVAAATSSLPEGIGGVRNWDYRYAWVRDAAFSVHAFRRIGMVSESAGFLSWVLRSIERAGRAAVLYDLDGRLPGHEWCDTDLEGYRSSPPVRWGNGAADQVQHDAYGEVVDCAWQWANAHGNGLPPDVWERIRPLVEEAGAVWDTPDHGIWEVRSDGRLFTYSVAMCQVALDRGARLVRRFGLPGDPDAWEAQARRLAEQILTRAWDDDLGAITESLDLGGSLDASVLALPSREVVAADHPRMVATTEAVCRGLGAGDGLLYRYHPDVSPDGLPGEEGAFLLCSFWLVDVLAKQGRLDDAVELYCSLCARAGPLGLLPEQIDPSTGGFLGNYPQAFSHVGVLASGVLLSRLVGSDGW
jgi:alpha,alpha-trehalase